MLLKPHFYRVSYDELHSRMQASARSIFSVMADIALEECTEKLDEQEQNWVTAMIGFEGTCRGLVALHCPEPLAQRIASGLIGAVGDVDTVELYDAMGEVANILGGDIKLYLGRGGSDIQLSIPAVFAGDGAFLEGFLAGPDTIACTMAAGEERLMVGVQLSWRDARA